MIKYQVDRRKWQKLTILEQMGNIYSEVGRTFKAKTRGSSADATHAAARAFDLFDATCEQLAAQKSPRLREVLRAREIFADEYLCSNYTTLERYFMQFATAARLRQFS